MSDHMNVLLIGTGPMAVAYARVLTAMGAACSALGRTSGSTARFEAETGVSTCFGGIDAIDAPRLAQDAAVVAVPVTELASVTTRLVEAGWRRILVEKPAGLNAADIARLGHVSLPTEIFVAYNRRFYASTTALRSRIANEGGVTSIHFDFSELVPRILAGGNTPRVLANWFYANATHIIDLAFHLAGEPTLLGAEATGKLDWHSPAIFAGHGRTRSGALFSYHADWSAPGRWGLEVRTRQSRFVLQPLETLKAQTSAGFAVEEIAIDDTLDKTYKPGLFAQVAAFLSDRPELSPLCKLTDHIGRLAALECMRTGGNWAADIG